jgi:hypothetical protein
MIFALKELYYTLHAALVAADLHRRLAAWRYVVTHQDLLDSTAGGGES